jgi:hypothetical protein
VRFETGSQLERFDCRAFSGSRVKSIQIPPGVSKVIFDPVRSSLVSPMAGEAEEATSSEPS